MVLISGLTLALVVLVIAGAAATAPKDAETEQKTETTSLSQETRPQDVPGPAQGRRAKRARTNIIPTSDEDDDAVWSTKGRRLRFGEPEEAPEVQQGLVEPIILRPYGPRWALPRRVTVGSVGGGKEAEETSWEWPRGRRCCNQVKGVMDLKRGYGKDRVKALVAKIIAGSGGAESEDSGGGEEDVFWAARGKRRRAQAEEESMEGPREPRSRV